MRKIHEWSEGFTIVTRSHVDHEIATDAHVEVLHADSSMPGPRTVLIAGQHGDEAAGPLWLLALGQQLVESLLKVRAGTLTVVRCANPAGLAAGRRWIKPDRYMSSVQIQRARLAANPEETRDPRTLDHELRLIHDMNRRWAAADRGAVESGLWDEFISSATQVVDLHVADTPDPSEQATLRYAGSYCAHAHALAETIREQTGLAQAGWRTLWSKPAGSLLVVCEEAGIPAVGVELPGYCPGDVPAPEWAVELYGPPSHEEWHGQRQRKLLLPEQQRAMPKIWAWVLGQHTFTPCKVVEAAPRREVSP